MFSPVWGLGFAVGVSVYMQMPVVKSSRQGLGLSLTFVSSSVLVLFFLARRVPGHTLEKLRQYLGNLRGSFFKAAFCEVTLAEVDLFVAAFFVSFLLRGFRL